MSVPWSDPSADIGGDLHRAAEEMARVPYRPTEIFLSKGAKQYLEDLEGYVRVLQRQLDRLPRRRVFARWHRRALLSQWWGTRWRDRLRKFWIELRYRWENRRGYGDDW